MYDYGREYDRPIAEVTRKKKFPYFSFRVVGVLLIIFGLCALACGAANVIYSEVTYGSTSTECTAAPLACTFTRVAAGVWGGLFAIIAGAVALRVKQSKSGGLKTKKNAAGVMAGLYLFLFGAAAIVITILELYEFNNVFYGVILGNLVIADLAKFILPIMVGGFLLMAWFTCLALLVMVCRAKVPEESKLQLDDPYRYRVGEDPLATRSYVPFERPLRPLGVQPPARRLEPRDYRPAYHSDPHLYRSPPPRPYVPQTRPAVYQVGQSRAYYDRSLPR